MNRRAACAMNSMATVDFYANQWGMKVVENVAKQDLAPKFMAPKFGPEVSEDRGACFAAGTLVHTKEGLVPIEQIKMGDYVLSKPENGGEQAYKRVLQTFAHAPERVVRLGYYIPANKPDKYGSNIGIINCTLNHPFWVRKLGWTAADELRNHGRKTVQFEDIDREDIAFATLTNVYVSDQPNVGWIPLRGNQADSIGALWDYAEHKLVNGNALALDLIAAYEHPDPFLKLPVYNLEVEDFHTYYVGEHGIWVHNQNCGDFGLNRMP